MNRNRLAYAGTMLAVMGMGGCGEDAVARDNLDEGYYGAICDWARNCPSSSEEAVIITEFERQTDASCEDLLPRLVGLSATPSELQGVDEGTIKYDGAQARRCLSFISNHCLDFGDAFAFDVCRDIFVGQLEVGETCRDSAECTPGNYCANDNSCAGTCMPQVALGEVCTEDDACAASDGTRTSCTLSGVDLLLRCREEVFTYDVAIGQPCGDLGTVGNTRTTAACATGLYCREVDGGTDVCAEPIAVGQPCDDDDACVNGFCSDGMCISPTIQRTAGAPCDFEQAIVCDGTIHLACGEGGTCEQIGDGTLGSPCVSETDQFFSMLTCNSGLYCAFDFSTPSCQARKSLGAQCERSDECESGRCDEGTCRGPELCSNNGGI